MSAAPRLAPASLPETVPACLCGDVDESRAYDDGAGYATAGLSRDCNPHPEDTALAACWDMGWDDTINATED